jgi:hypothetical protein
MKISHHFTKVGLTLKAVPGVDLLGLSNPLRIALVPGVARGAADPAGLFRKAAGQCIENQVNAVTLAQPQRNQRQWPRQRRHPAHRRRLRRSPTPTPAPPPL